MEPLVDNPRFDAGTGGRLRPVGEPLGFARRIGVPKVDPTTGMAMRNTGSLPAEVIASSFGDREPPALRSSADR